LPKLRAHWQAKRGLPPQRSAGGERTSPRIRLRHEVEHAAGEARSPEEFFAGLRAAGVAVRERFSELHPDELTSYSVALPADHDAGGKPVWKGGGSLAPELSLPRLRSRWAAGETSSEGTGSTTAVSAEERQKAWREARQAADNAAEEVRRLTHEDPAAAGDAARSAADLLNVAARAGEPAGKGPLHDAARAYDRASRELYARPSRRSPGGADLRLAAMTLALVARAGRDDGAALVALVVSLSALLDAVADLRATQARVTQAAAARGAADQLRQVGASRQAPPWGAAPVRAPTISPRRPQEPPAPPRPERGR